MKLAHRMIPRGVEPLLELAGVVVGYDPYLLAFTLCVPKTARNGLVSYFRYKIAPDLEDWQDAIRSVYQYGNLGIGGQ